jgi:UDP-N-acetylmuramoylalanine--D-glutamate ligase
MELKNRKILVVGLARSGVAAANFLLREGAIVSITDRKGRSQLESTLNRLTGPVKLRLGGHEAGDFLEAALIVVSPGVPADLPELALARDRAIPIIGEVELAYRCLEGHFIGVTGSNGKTTTTTLIGEICRCAGQNPFVAGNIGRPLTEALLEVEPPHRFVVELSSFQLESIQDFHCNVAVFLNLTPDHLDRHRSAQAYLAAKERIFLNQTGQDWAVVNGDDPRLTSTSTAARRFPFSIESRLDEGAFLDRDALWIRANGKEHHLLDRSGILLRGRHNLSNILAASAAAYLSGVEPESIGLAVRAFRGVEHRLEFVRQLDGVDYFNDSKATNVDSAMKALESFSNPLVVIMGGLDKEGDFSLLRDLVQEKVRLLIVLGAAAAKIQTQLSGATPIITAGSMADAVVRASLSSRPGDTVLLAPGCASFDMFENYEHRGREFKNLVGGLGTPARSGVNEEIR